MEQPLLTRIKKSSLYTTMCTLPKIFFLLKIFKIKNKRIFKTCLITRKNMAAPHKTQLLKLTGHTDWIKTLSFSKSGKLLATGSWDKKAIIYCLDHLSNNFGKEILKLSCHTNYVNSVHFSICENYLATASKDMYAIVTTINKGNNNSISFGKEYLRLKGHSNDITSIRYSPCGNYLATGSCDRMIFIYGVQEGKENFGKVKIGRAHV